MRVMKQNSIIMRNESIKKIIWATDLKVFSDELRKMIDLQE